MGMQSDVDQWRRWFVDNAIRSAAPILQLILIVVTISWGQVADWLEIECKVSEGGRDIQFYNLCLHVIENN